MSLKCFIVERWEGLKLELTFGELSVDGGMRRYSCIAQDIIWWLLEVKVKKVRVMDYMLVLSKWDIVVFMMIIVVLYVSYAFVQRCFKSGITHDFQPSVLLKNIFALSSYLVHFFAKLYFFMFFC